MKILLISDTEDSSLYDYYRPEKVEGVDLILSCGDLNYRYLEFLVTMAGCPLLYIHGNHDERYLQHPPEGCIDIDDKVYNYHGFRILGLGGSRRYGNSTFMYTENQMEKRIRKLKPVLYFSEGFDLLLTHAPAAGYGDLPDLPHRGFECFNTLMEDYHPMYMCHGHVHEEYGNFVRTRQHPSGTKIVNASGKTTIEFDFAYKEKKSPFYTLYLRRNKLL